MQSLPLLRRNTLSRTTTATSQVRAMAARRLIQARLSGRISAQEARAAMEQGEYGVAKALGRHLYQASINAAVPDSGMGGQLELLPDQHAALASLLRELHAEGIITDADFAGTTAATAARKMVSLVLTAVERMAADAAKGMPATATDYAPLSVTPAAIGMLLPFIQDAGCDHPSNVGVALVSVEDTPFVAIADPSSKEEMSAICCLIGAINSKGHNWLIVPPTDLLDLIDPHLAEIVRDIRAVIPTGPICAQSLPAAARDSVEEFFGPLEGDNAEYVIGRVNEILDATPQVEDWKLGDGRLEAWLSEGQGKNHEMVKNLLALYHAIPKGKRVERETLGDGHIAGMYVITHKMWDAFNESIQMLSYEYNPVEAFVTAKNKSSRPHVEALRQAVMASTVATALSRIIIDAHAN